MHKIQLFDNTCRTANFFKRNIGARFWQRWRVAKDRRAFTNRRVRTTTTREMSLTKGSSDAMTGEGIGLGGPAFDPLKIFGRVVDHADYITIGNNIKCVAFEILGGDVKSVSRDHCIGTRYAYCLHTCLGASDDGQSSACTTAGLM